MVINQLAVKHLFAPIFTFKRSLCQIFAFNKCTKHIVSEQLNAHSDYGLIVYTNLVVQEYYKIKCNAEWFFMLIKLESFDSVYIDYNLPHMLHIHHHKYKAI